MGPPPDDDEGGMPPMPEGDKAGGPPAGMPGPGMRTGTYLMKLIKETCEKNHVEILLNTAVSDAEAENGKITAIIAHSPEGKIKVRCKAVILATGSWISNRELLKKANPTFARLPAPVPRPSGHQNCNYTGDGIYRRGQSRGIPGYPAGIDGK